MKRYMALDSSGKVLDVGNRIMDVEGGFGARILVDYKAKRWAWKGRYPTYRYVWHNGLSSLGDVLRSGN